MRTISRVRKGALHDTVVWTRADQRKTLLWVVRDREIVQRLLGLNGNKPWERVFSLGGAMCFELPYGPERPVSRFAVLREQRPGKKRLYKKSSGKKRLEQKTLWLRIVSLCIVEGLPYELLYLLLKKRRLQISREGEIYFSYDLDLADLPRKATEKDCTSLCVEVLLELMQKRGRWEKEPSVSLLIRKKRERGMYKGFTQLYHDVSMYDPEPACYKIWAAKARGLVLFREDVRRRLSRIALCLAVIVIVAAAVLFASQIVTGDVPFLFLLRGAIQQIGTESMLQ